MDVPIGEADDDLWDKPPPPGPTPREVRRRWAEAGDIEALLDLIRGTAWSSISVREQLQNLLVACRAGARADPERFARRVFAEMVGLVAFLTLRTGLFVAGRVAGRGPQPCTPTLADFSPDVVERLLPRLCEMHRATAEVLHAQAATARMWALARAKQAGAERAAAADRGPDRRRGAAGGAAAGAGVPRQAVVPLPERRRRRG